MRSLLTESAWVHAFVAHLKQLDTQSVPATLGDKGRELWVTMGELDPVAVAEAVWDESLRLSMAS